MPCHDGYYENICQVFVEKGIQTSRLCAVFKVLEQQNLLYQVLNAADWVGSGVSKNCTLQWWSTHQREDFERGLREEAARKRKLKRQLILSKLSDEERQILNLTED